MHKHALIRITQDSDVVVASMQTMRMAQHMGMNAVDCTMCATAVSELATNIMRYAKQGEIRLQHDEKKLFIIAQDQGPGIANVEQAMQEGYSGGTGLGMGLSGIARNMDDMHIESHLGHGTCIRIHKILRAVSQRSRHVKPLQKWDEAWRVQPYIGERGSGDGILSTRFQSYRCMALWDVSGHGDNAYALSKKIALFLKPRLAQSPQLLLQALHTHFQGTQGLVGVITRLNTDNHWLDYAGIGNVSLLHMHAQGLRRLILQQGIMGYQIRTPINQRLHLQTQDTLIMHSDGLSIKRHFNISRQQNAAQVLQNIMRNYQAQQQDDRACLVLRHQTGGVNETKISSHTYS